jgi:hypothetical protein
VSSVSSLVIACRAEGKMPSGQPAGRPRYLFVPVIAKAKSPGWDAGAF